MIPMLADCFDWILSSVDIWLTGWTDLYDRLDASVTITWQISLVRELTSFDDWLVILLFCRQSRRNSYVATKLEWLLIKNQYWLSWVTDQLKKQVHLENVDLYRWEITNVRPMPTGGAYLETKLILFTNHSARAGYDTRAIFERSLSGLNSEFYFS